MNSMTIFMTAEAGYPSFAPMFDEYDYGNNELSSPYLNLLNLPGMALSGGVATDLIPHVLAKSADVSAEIVSLFTDGNWRPHLVGAATMIVVPKIVNDEILEALWNAMRFGSWVSPQLAVAAFLCDSKFEEKAGRRIEEGCPRYEHNHPDKSWGHDSKGLAALVFVYRQLPNVSSWLERAVSRPFIADLLANDQDGGEGIASDWLQQIKSYSLR